MSDMEVAVSAPPSTPTAEIAANVIETSESTPSEPVESPAAPAAPAAPPEPELPPAAKFLVAKGHKWGKRADGRTDLAFFPATTTANFLDEYLSQHKSTWEGERGTLEKQRKEYEDALTEYRTLIAGDPKAFLEQLSSFDPRYKSFLETPAPAPQPVAQMPGPDVDLQDGSKTYSVEGIQKLIEWAVDAKMLPKVEERLKPLTEREAAEKDRAARESHERQSRERFQSQLKEAESWPMFGALPADGSLTPFQQEVLKVLQEDTSKKLTLHQAYMKAFTPRFAEEDTAKRERLLKETSEAAKASPTVSRTGAEVPRAPGAPSTRDIAARIIEQAGG